MNILIIGNGFDLAHDLPTKYGDFLKYTIAFNRWRDVCRSGCIKAAWETADDNNREYLLHFSNLLERDERLFEELSKLISDNLWIDYFEKIYSKRESAGKDGWIDFESEISKIIQTADEAMAIILAEINNGSRTGKMTTHQLYVLAPLLKLDGPLVHNPYSFEEPVIPDLTKNLLRDLNRLIRCLEIYLCVYLESDESLNLLPDISSLPYLDKVLSFNYTDTYERLYDKTHIIEYDYIHGKAFLHGDVESNNMVLGIDEYLDESRKNTDIEFIEFKKFYQRIHKETGCLYRNWVDEIKSNAAIYETTGVREEHGKRLKTTTTVSSHKVFIFGHSLDITDRDVLRDFILNDNVQTTIFYLNKTDYGKKIANLVRIIGQDELIKRTGGKTKTITFQKINSGGK